jgi:hypothetical protein
MKIDTLESLARAATPGWADVTDFMLEQGVHPFDVAYIKAITPERILALLAVVKAAQAMREQLGPCVYCGGHGWYVVQKPNFYTGDAEEAQQQCAFCSVIRELDAALARLEEMK